MNCMECNAPISPAFKAAIKANVCPGCGGQIMNDNAVSLMNELREAMEKMPGDPEGLAGWLLSNYHMEKIGDAEPTDFYGKPARPKVSNNASNVRENLKIANNPLQEFLKNTTSKNQKNVEHYRNLAQEINGIIESDEQNSNISVNDEDLPELEFPEYTKKVLGAMVEGKSEHVPSEPKINNDGFEYLPPALQRDRLKRLEQQQKITSGIHEPGKGFSRSG